MKKVLVIPSNLKASAIVYYRGIQPARFLIDNKHADVKFLTKFNNDKGRIDLSAFAWADILITQRFYYDTPFLRPLREGYRRFKGLKIYETDDLVWDIPYKLIRKEYKKTKDFTEQLIQEADVITCTTEYLKQQILKKRQQCRVDVIPNSVDSAMWMWERPCYTRTRVIYAAGGTHWKEIKFVKKVLKKVKKDYDIETILLSPYHKEKEGGVWDHVYNFVPFKNFPKYMMGLAPDIGLAPIVQKTPFMLSKSEVKFLDFTMAGAASVVENCETYSKVENALKANTVDEYYEAIVKLLDIDYRDKLIKDAKEEIWKKFDIHENVKLWKKAIRK